MAVRALQDIGVQFLLHGVKSFYHFGWKRLQDAIAEWDGPFAASGREAKLPGHAILELGDQALIAK